MSEPENPDPRIPQYLAIVEKIKNGDYELGDLVIPPDQFGQALCDLAASLKAHSKQTEKLEQVEQQNETPKSLNELKTTFLGIVAHDLRSPVSFIQTSADLLLDDKDGAFEQDRQDLLESISNQANHVLNLLNELLDLTEIESGNLSLSFETFDLSRFLEDVVHSQSRLAATKGTQLDLEEIPPLEVTADKIRLNQVMDNLISNGVKFSPPGSVIKVRARPMESWIRIEVQDQGPGIQEKDRARLFQPFARLSARPTGREKSTGLGLAITRRIVDAHGGQIEVDSEPGEGAVFWFTLPMRVPKVI